MSHGFDYFDEEKNLSEDEDEHDDDPDDSGDHYITLSVTSGDVCNNALIR